MSYTWKPDNFSVEDHPFPAFIPPEISCLIVGTFPTHKRNFRYKFYYSGIDNLFWNVLERVLNHQFCFNEGIEAVQERELFLAEMGIGITDMIEKCYRRNGYSTDDHIFPISFRDIFAIIDQHTSINRVILTSRTDLTGALWHFQTYCMQKGYSVVQLTTTPDKLMKGRYHRVGRVIEVYVPYSTSSSYIQGRTDRFETVVKMYAHSLQNL
jgi:G:T/U-mismatch repair DNA glycosylase